MDDVSVNDCRRFQVHGSCWHEVKNCWASIMYEIERRSRCWLLAANALARWSFVAEGVSTRWFKCGVALSTANSSWLLKSLKIDNLLTEFGTLSRTQVNSTIEMSEKPKYMFDVGGRVGVGLQSYTRSDIRQSQQNEYGPSTFLGTKACSGKRAQRTICTQDLVIVPDNPRLVDYTF